MNHKTYAIVTARMASSRFPGKAVASINGTPAIEYLIKRIQLSAIKNNIIIATTSGHEDDIIYDIALDNKCKVFRSEKTVIEKVIDAAEFYKVDTIVDITGDCPLMCPYLINTLLDEFKRKKADYVSNVITRSWPKGFDLQIYKTEILKLVQDQIWDEAHYNHLGWNIMHYSGLLKNLQMYNYPPYPGYAHPDWEVTLDYKEDLKVINKIVKHFDDNTFSANQVTDYLRNNPKILNINKDVKRKTAGEG